MPLTACHAIHAMQAMQARRITLSMNGSFAGSVSIQHVKIVLIMFTPVASSQATEILWPTLGSLEHAQRDKDAS
jgi:hypothetical protein